MTIERRPSTESLSDAGHSGDRDDATTTGVRTPSSEGDSEDPLGNPTFTDEAANSVRPNEPHDRLLDYDEIPLKYWGFLGVGPGVSVFARPENDFSRGLLSCYSVPNPQSRTFHAAESSGAGPYSTFSNPPNPPNPPNPLNPPNPPNPSNPRNPSSRGAATGTGGSFDAPFFSRPRTGTAGSAESARPTRSTRSPATSRGPAVVLPAFSTSSTSGGPTGRSIINGRIAYHYPGGATTSQPAPAHRRSPSAAAAAPGYWTNTSNGHRNNREDTPSATRSFAFSGRDNGSSSASMPGITQTFGSVKMGSGSTSFEGFYSSSGRVPQATQTFGNANIGAAAAAPNHWANDFNGGSNTPATAGASTATRFMSNEPTDPVRTSSGSERNAGKTNEEGTEDKARAQINNEIATMIADLASGISDVVKQLDQNIRGNTQ